MTIQLLFAILCIGSASAIFVCEIPVRTVVFYESDGSRLEQQLDLNGRLHGVEVYQMANGEVITTRYSHGEVIESSHCLPDGTIARHVRESFFSGLILQQEH